MTKPLSQAERDRNRARPVTIRIRVTQHMADALDALSSKQGLDRPLVAGLILRAGMAAARPSPQSAEIIRKIRETIAANAALAE